MVLESNQITVFPFNLDIPDTSGCVIAWVNSLHIKNGQARQPSTLGRLIGATHHLVATADGQHRHSSTYGPVNGSGLGIEQIRSDAPLFAILTTTHEDQIIRIWVKVVAKTDLHDIEIDSTSRAPMPQAEYVAAVAIEVHQGGVQVRKSQRPARSTRYQSQSSQYRERPASLANCSRTDSIAV
jgi:hypothetical protein